MKRVIFIDGEYLLDGGILEAVSEYFEGALVFQVSELYKLTGELIQVKTYDP